MKIFLKLFRMLLNNIGSVGLRGDQTNLYVKDMYKVAYDVREQKDPKYSKIYAVKSGSEVTGAGIKETQLLGADELDKETTEGSDIVFVSPIQGWVFYGKYTTYKKGVKFSFQSVEDDVKLGNLLKSYAATWADRAIVAKETMAAAVFNNGGDLLGNSVFDGTHVGNTAVYTNLLYDGLPMFNLSNNTRSSKGGSTYYNASSGIGSVSAANFETLYNIITATNNKDEQDIIRANPVDTVLTQPGADAFSMEKILNTTRGLPGGQLNDLNPYYGIIDMHIAWDYLTVSSCWYIGKRQDDGLQFHERQEPTFRYFRDERNLTYNASVHTRFGVFIKDWRKWGRAGGSYA